MQTVNNSSTNTTNSTPTPTSYFQTYQIIVTSLNAPFVIVFLLIFLVALLTYLFKRKTMKRNQHVLFIMLFALQWATLLNLATRIVSELAYLEKDKSLADSTFFAIKAIDRCCVFVVVYIEILILAFICKVFLETCKEINEISEKTLKVSKILLYCLLGLILALYIMACLVFLILGGLMSSFAVKPATVSVFQIVIFTLAGGVFLFSITTISIPLNITAYTLYNSLKKAKDKLEESKSKSQEFEQSYRIKKTALKKTLILQIGLTLTLLWQFIGFIFIPLTLVLNYFLVVFFMISNIGIVLFSVLLLGIYNPLKEVQHLFRHGSKDSHNFQLNDTTTMHSSQHSREGSRNSRYSRVVVKVNSPTLEDEIVSPVDNPTPVLQTV